MSKNLPMFWNCPWILPRWARSGGIEEIGGTTGGMMGAGGPVTRWISDQWGDGLRKDLLIDLQDVWWNYWKWVLFRIHMNQGEACTSHGIIYLNYFGMFLLGWTPFRQSHSTCFNFVVEIDHPIKSADLDVQTPRVLLFFCFSFPGSKLLSVLRLGGQQLVAGLAACAKYSPSSNASHARHRMVGVGETINKSVA